MCAEISQVFLLQQQKEHSVRNTQDINPATLRAIIKMKSMVKTKALLDFVTEDQILEVMILWQSNRKMDAARLLSAYTFPKWNLTTLQAIKILTSLESEWK